MEHELKKLIDRWKAATYTALNLDEIPAATLQALLRETYAVLTVFHKQDSVPKAISALLLEMEDFLYFASLMEEKEMGDGYYGFRRVHAVVKALEAGFLGGEYGCDFPKLTIACDDDRSVVLDLESGSLNDIG